MWNEDTFCNLRRCSFGCFCTTFQYLNEKKKPPCSAAVYNWRRECFSRVICQDGVREADARAHGELVTQTTWNFLEVLRKKMTHKFWQKNILWCFFKCSRHVMNDKTYMNVTRQREAPPVKNDEFFLPPKTVVFVAERQTESQSVSQSEGNISTLPNIKFMALWNKYKKPERTSKQMRRYNR